MIVIIVMNTILGFFIIIDTIIVIAVAIAIVIVSASVIVLAA